jgi:hypothetical protein
LESIDKQSVAGAISIGTYGLSLRHGRLSQPVTALSIALSNNLCTFRGWNPSLFRTGLRSLSALCFIVQATFQAVLDHRTAWTQDLYLLLQVLQT